MKKGDLLFVYGTLRKGEGHDLSQQRGAEFVSEDRINGALYGLGHFPGIKGTLTGVEEFRPDQPTVSGDVFRLTDDKIADTLDRYEGYPDLYERETTLTETGLTVWVYVYNHGVHEDTRIKDGDWRRHAMTSSPRINTAG